MMKQRIAKWVNDHYIWLDDNFIWFQLVLIFAIAIGVNLLFWNLVYPHFEKPSVEVEAHVIDTGYAGVTVEYMGEYGGMVTKTVDTQGEYALGDTVTFVLDGRNGTLK